MNAKQLPTVDCIALMDETVRNACLDSLRNLGSKGILIFENHDLSSPNVGKRFAIGWGGERNTLKERPLAPNCPVQPPEGWAWQFQLVAYSDDLQYGVVPEKIDVEDYDAELQGLEDYDDGIGT